VVSKKALTIDTSNFNRAMRDLSRLSGVSFKQVILSETGAILQKTISNQVAADASKIRARQAKGKISKPQMQELLRRRGLAKQSWLAIARQLGVPIQAPAYVTKATVMGKAYDQQVSTSERRGGSRVTLIIENSMQAAVKSMGRVALLKAINGRAAYFRNNLRRGVFSKVSAIAKKYPGLKVRGF
jgi:hypothetical protein